MTGRVICQISCGATSAVATKLTLAKYGHERVVIVNAFLKEEHEDNRRFLRDCEAWFAHPVTVIRDEKFNASADEVWTRERFMKNEKGAPCSRALKRKLFDAFRQPGDKIVIGYAADEVDRAERLFDSVADIEPEFPLIERGLMKSDCMAIIERAGIKLPAMYALGFNNANCIGCVKGGMGYWNKIKIVFPERFETVARIQESLGPGANLWKDKTGKYISLRELPPDAGRHDEPVVSCSFFCEVAEQDLAEST